MHIGDPGPSKRTYNKGKAKATTEDLEGALKAMCY